MKHQKQSPDTRNCHNFGQKLQSAQHGGACSESLASKKKSRTASPVLQRTEQTLNTPKQTIVVWSSLVQIETPTMSTDRVG